MSAPVTVRVRFFAGIRELLDCAELTLELPEQVKSVGQVREWLASRGGKWEQALGARRALLMAYQQKMCQPGQLLSPEQTVHELAFFPPVTGG